MARSPDDPTASPVPRHPHHRRTQQPLLILVPPLQLLKNVMVRHLSRIHHFDRLVHPRIECLPQTSNRLPPDLHQRIPQLPPTKLTPAANLTPPRSPST